MKILLISDTDNISLNIHNYLKKNGYESTLLTHYNSINDDSIINISNINFKKIIWFKHALRSFFYRHLIFRITGYSYYQDIREQCNYYSINRIKRKIKFKPDIILILFDYRIVTTKTIAELYEWSCAKIFWLMVDMKPFTGGCSYSGDCNKYITDCDNCPAVGNFLFKHFPKYTLKTKVTNLNNVNVTFLTGSNIQTLQAKNSTLLRGKNVLKIFFPVDESIFFYRRKEEARLRFSLPKDKTILLIGAMYLKEKRKGMDLLIESLRMLSYSDKVKDIMLLIIGNGDLSELESMPYEYRKFGFLNYYDLSYAYQSSDAFLCPSIEDSGPIMVNQSIMCGTPVISFETGVCIDLVLDGMTGFISKQKDSKSYYNSIMNFISRSDEERNNMSLECQQISKALGYQVFFNSLKLTK